MYDCAMRGSWRRWRRRGREGQLSAICAGAIAVAVMACGGASPVPDPVRRSAWYELQSSHIQLTTDLPVDLAGLHIRELEQSWRALTAMYVQIAPWAKLPERRFS